VVRSVHAHARLVSIDLKVARAAPGVLAAWAAADLPEVSRPVLSGSEGAHKGRPFAAPVLAPDVVRYVGEPVAVVVADDPYLVADGLELVTVEYEPLPALVTPEAALASASRLHEAWPDNAAVQVRGAVGEAEQELGGPTWSWRRRSTTPGWPACRSRRAACSRTGTRSRGSCSSGRPRRTRTPCATPSRASERPAEEVRVLVPTWAAASGPGRAVPRGDACAAAAPGSAGR
jgi:CO/xanthine dehydrogenase Mo-binding subunit